MVALGIVTLVLTSFMLIFYGYLSKHTERDVSFFLSVGVISIVMNLCTNAGGLFVLSYLYLAIAVLFLALGFAVSTSQTIAFYTSIGPWFKTTFTNTKLIGWQLLSFILFPAGIVLFFVYYKKNREFANQCGKAALWGLLLWGLLLWAILGIVL